MILMTRPACYEYAFRAAFPGETLMPCSVLEPTPIGQQGINIEGYDALIFTSRLAVQHAKARVSDRAIKVYAVGPGTASMLREAGFKDIVSGSGTAADLVPMLASAQFKRALYLSGSVVTMDLQAIDPVRIHRFPVYDVRPVQSLSPLVTEALARTERWFAPFFSTRSYKIFQDLLMRAGAEAECTRGHMIPIARTVVRKSSLVWGRCTFAPTPDAAGVYSALREVL